MARAMSNRSIFFLVFFVVQNVLSNLAQEQVRFSVIRQWEYVNYTWPDTKSLEAATADGQYIPENIVIAGVIYFQDWYYLTMPRMKHGVPATLGRISAAPEKVTNPSIVPFPSWEYNKLGDCKGLQNVQNVEIDPKGQMWIIDGGHAASLTNTPMRNCYPKIIVFDLNKNTTVAIHTFPETVAAKNGSFLYDVVVDDEFAYITDNSRHDPGIIVFSQQLNSSWKIRHSQSMQADPAAQHFSVNGVPISAPINIAGIAMRPNIEGNDTDSMNENKQIFYCPLSSLHLYSISTSVLRNENNSHKQLDYPGQVMDVGVKASQTDGMIMTNQGILYYGLLSDNSIANWDSSTPFASNQKILSRDSAYIQWTNSFTMDLKGNIIVLTNTLQRFIYEKLDLNQTNFWLISAHIGQKSYLYSKPSQFTAENATNANGVHSKISDTSGIVEDESVLKRNVSPPDAGNQAVVHSATTIMLAILCFVSLLIYY